MGMMLSILFPDFSKLGLKKRQQSFRSYSRHDFAGYLLNKRLNTDIFQYPSKCENTDLLSINNFKEERLSSISQHYTCTFFFAETLPWR